MERGSSMTVSTFGEIATATHANVKDRLMPQQHPNQAWLLLTAIQLSIMKESEIMRKQEWLDLISADIKEHGEVYHQGIYEDLPYSVFRKYCEILGLESIDTTEED